MATHKPQKFIIFDAGPIITFTMNGLLDVLERLKYEFQRKGGEFIITPQVKKEVIDNPMKTKKYELEAVMVQNLLDKGILKMSSEFIDNNKLSKETKKIEKELNSSFVYKLSGKKIELIHNGEASCLAFSKLINKENLIVIDERTTRLLTENSEGLEHMMEKKLHADINVDKKKLKIMSKFRFIRSSELVYIAYKKDVLGMNRTKQVLDALLYAVKFKGSAVSSDEIKEIKSLS